MTKQRELRRHLRNPDLRGWIQKNEAWFTANPSALHALLENPDMLSALQARMESKKNKINRRLAKAGRRAVAVHQPNTNSAVQTAKPKRKPLFKLPKLSLSNLNLETATERLSRAAEVMDTIRNLTGIMKG